VAPDDGALQAGSMWSADSFVTPCCLCESGSGSNDGTSTAEQQNKFVLKIKPASATEPPSLANI